MGGINVLNERSPDVYFTMRTFDGANRFGYRDYVWVIIDIPGVVFTVVCIVLN